MPDPNEPFEELLKQVVKRWEEVFPGDHPSTLPLFSSLFYLSRQLQQFHDRVLKPYGRTLAEYQILSYIRSVGPASPTHLNRFLLHTPAGMTYTLDQLEKAKLLSRRPSQKDRRSIEITLTPAGRREAERLMKAEGQAQKHFAAALGNRDLEQAVKTVARLNSLLAADADRS